MYNGNTESNFSSNINRTYVKVNHRYFLKKISDHGGGAIVRPSGFLIFRASCTSIYSLISSYILLCVFALFHSCCSYARVFGETALHEFNISIVIINCTSVPFILFDPFLSSTVFPFLFFLFIGLYCGAVVFGLMGCKSLSPSRALPTSFNNTCSFREAK